MKTPTPEYDRIGNLLMLLLVISIIAAVWPW
jgi:hypothetical protein